MKRIIFCALDQGAQNWSEKEEQVHAAVPPHREQLVPNKMFLLFQRMCLDVGILATALELSPTTDSCEFSQDYIVLKHSLFPWIASYKSAGMRRWPHCEM